MSNGTQALDRAAELLSIVVRSPHAVPYSTLVEQTDLPRSTTSRLLQGLERNGLLERDSQGAFRGGALFAHYAAHYDRVELMVAAAQPVLEQIADKTGESVNLAVVRGQAVVHVAQIDSTFMIGAMNWMGLDVPPHASALGKVMYAYDLLLRPTKAMEALTTLTITDPVKFVQHLERIRVDGYAVTRGELEDGLDAVAVPVRSADGPIIAALGVSGPSFRIGDQLDDFAALMADQSERLTELLSGAKHI
jgi:DNA-binding IclR family transcriptional regulator